MRFVDDQGNPADFNFSPQEQLHPQPAANVDFEFNSVAQPNAPQADFEFGEQVDPNYNSAGNSGPVNESEINAMDFVNNALGLLDSDSMLTSSNADLSEQNED